MRQLYHTTRTRVYTTITTYTRGDSLKGTLQMVYGRFRSPVALPGHIGLPRGLLRTRLATTGQY